MKKHRNMSFMRRVSEVEVDLEELTLIIMLKGKFKKYFIKFMIQEWFKIPLYGYNNIKQHCMYIK